MFENFPPYSDFQGGHYPSSVFDFCDPIAKERPAVGVGFPYLDQIFGDLCRFSEVLPFRGAGRDSSLHTAVFGHHGASPAAKGRRHSAAQGGVCFGGHERAVAPDCVLVHGNQLVVVFVPGSLTLSQYGPDLVFFRFG